MADTLKIAIPLISEDINRSDVIEDNGFVGAFFNDINRPYLDGHIFLLYKYFDGSEEPVKRDIKFVKSKAFHSRKVIMVNKVPYLLYTFCAIGDKFLRIREGLIPMRKDDMMRVFKFWEFKDEAINTLMFSKTPILTKDNSSVPEVDYAPRRFENGIEMPSEAYVVNAI